jgi:hypothetical protein
MGNLIGGYCCRRIHKQENKSSLTRKNVKSPINNLKKFKRYLNSKKIKKIIKRKVSSSKVTTPKIKCLAAEPLKINIPSIVIHPDWKISTPQLDIHSQKCPSVYSVSEYSIYGDNSTNRNTPEISPIISPNSTHTLEHPQTKENEEDDIDINELLLSTLTGDLTQLKLKYDKLLEDIYNEVQSQFYLDEIRDMCIISPSIDNLVYIVFDREEIIRPLYKYPEGHLCEGIVPCDWSISTDEYINTYGEPEPEHYFLILTLNDIHKYCDENQVSVWTQEKPQKQAWFKR